MKKIISPFVLFLLVTFASAATLTPIQLLNPTGSSNGQILTSTGPTTAPVWASSLSTPVTVSNGGTGVATLTGLVFGNGTSAMSAYAGTSCTNQFPRSLNASGVATCASVANTDLSNSSLTLGSSSVSLGATASSISGLSYLGMADGTQTAPSYSYSGETGTGFYRSAANTVSYASGTSERTAFSGNNFQLNNAGAIYWTNTTNPRGPQDIGLARDGTGILNQRNSTTAQTHRVTNTYTNSSNYEWGVMDWTTTANTLTIGAQAAGTGTLRKVNLVGTAVQNNGTLLYSNTAPTISSGFGTSAAVASNNGTVTYRVNVGTGGTASTGVIGLPTASNGWNCSVQEFAPSATALLSVTVVSASDATSVTVTNDLLSTGAATAWQASQVLMFNCAAY